jgi:Insertion element 4 transposase N-terminal
MVDAALAETCRLQRRDRDLPARVVVYLLLAGCLFAEPGYPQIWAKLTAGLGGLPFPVPAASAMTQARRRLSPGPLRALFFLLRCRVRPDLFSYCPHPPGVGCPAVSACHS